MSAQAIRRHFGYRTAGEVLSFMRTALEIDGATTATFLDRAVFSKVLPRLRGEDTPALRKALGDLQAICKLRALPACETKLGAMAEQLKATGVTRFWA